jgi:ABC-2 type transport system permease protein
VRSYRALLRTLLRTTDTRARRAGFLALSAIGVVVALVVAANDPTDPVRAAVKLVDVFNLTFLVPVAALVYATASLGDPTDDGTLVYLWLRPVARSTIVAAAATSSMLVILPVAIVPVVVEAAVLRGGSDVVVAAGVAGAVAGVAYAAWFLLLGLVTNRSLVWGIGYVLIYESFLARGGKWLGALSIHAHAASLLARLADRRLRLAYFSAPAAVVGSAAIAAAALAVATSRLRRAEVP